MQLARRLRRHSFTAFPARCVLCSALTGRRIDLCEACENDLPWTGRSCRTCALPLPPGATGSRCVACVSAPPPFQTATAAFAYRFPVNRMITEFKENRRMAFGAALSCLLAQSLAEKLTAEKLTAEKLRGTDFLPADTVVAPVPLSAGRLRRRGFNQAEEIAQQVSHELGFPLRAGLLKRSRSPGDQKKLGASARKQSVRGTYAVSPGACAPRSVLLIDDVMTTGATVREISRVLLNAGAMRVNVAILARTPQERRKNTARNRQALVIL